MGEAEPKLSQVTGDRVERQGRYLNWVPRPGADSPLNTNRIGSRHLNKQVKRMLEPLL